MTVCQINRIKNIKRGSQAVTQFSTDSIFIYLVIPEHFYNVNISILDMLIPVKLE